MFPQSKHAWANERYAILSNQFCSSAVLQSKLFSYLASSSCESNSITHKTHTPAALSNSPRSTKVFTSLFCTRKVFQFPQIPSHLKEDSTAGILKARSEARQRNIVYELTKGMLNHAISSQLPLTSSFPSTSASHVMLSTVK